MEGADFCNIRCRSWVIAALAILFNKVGFISRICRALFSNFINAFQWELVISCGIVRKNGDIDVLQPILIDRLRLNSLHVPIPQRKRALRTHLYILKICSYFSYPRTFWPLSREYQYLQFYESKVLNVFSNVFWGGLW